MMYDVMKQCESQFFKFEKKILIYLYNYINTSINISSISIPFSYPIQHYRYSRIQNRWYEPIVIIINFAHLDI
jgi:hypothetical protein